MNHQVRKVGYLLVALFVLLLAKLTWVQVVDAKRLDHMPANFRRIQAREYSIERGPIVSADGVVLAKSTATAGRLRYERSYPTGRLDAHVTGYYSPLLRSSLTENAFNTVLLGGDAPLTFSTLLERLEGIRVGNTVTLSIDTRVQRAAAEALDGRPGAVVALDPKTGFVIALYSNPTYDPSTVSTNDSAADQRSWDELRTDPAQPALPRAFRQTYPPGSTFKIITAAAALDNGIANADTEFPEEESITLPQTSRPLENDDGETCGGTFVESFAKSCNTVFARLAMQLGADKLVAQAKKFGYDTDVPFELRAVRSAIPEPETFARDVPGLAKSGIGQQNVRSTPLEVALTSAAVANGGVMMAPQVVTKVTDPKGGALTDYAPKEWQRAMSQQAADTLRQMMVAVVEGGTGSRVQIEGVQVAGKTGTAQSGEGKEPHAWFTGFAPAQDPRVAVAVLVENGGYGGRTAAPIAKAVMQAVLGRG